MKGDEFMDSELFGVVRPGRAEYTPLANSERLTECITGGRWSTVQQCSGRMTCPTRSCSGATPETNQAGAEQTKHLSPVVSGAAGPGRLCQGRSDGCGGVETKRAARGVPAHRHAQRQDRCIRDCEHFPRRLVNRARTVAADAGAGQWHGVSEPHPLPMM